MNRRIVELLGILIFVFAVVYAMTFVHAADEPEDTSADCVEEIPKEAFKEPEVKAEGEEHRGGKVEDWAAVMRPPFPFGPLLFPKKEHEEEK